MATLIIESRDPRLDPREGDIVSLASGLFWRVDGRDRDDVSYSIRNPKREGVTYVATCLSDWRHLCQQARVKVSR